MTGNDDVRPDAGSPVAVTFAPLPADTRFDMGVVVGTAAGNYDGAFVSSRVP